MSGSFQGGDAGLSSIVQFIGSEDFGAFMAACTSPTGLKAATIGLGRVGLE